MPSPRFSPPSFRSRLWFERHLDQGFMGLTLMVAIAVALVLGAIVVILVVNARPAIATFGLKFLISSAWNPDRPLARWIQLATTTLSGLPAIIAGVFAYGLLVRSDLTGYSAISGGMALSVLMLPTIVHTTEEALRLVPDDWRWAATSVGASPYQTVLYVVLPAASPGILTGVMLAIARAAGETAPLIFTALSSSFWPRGVFEPIATLSVLIFNYATVPFAPQQELAWAGAFILVLLVLVTNVVARLVTAGQRG